MIVDNDDAIYGKRTGKTYLKLLSEYDFLLRKGVFRKCSSKSFC